MSSLDNCKQSSLVVLPLNFILRQDKQCSLSDIRTSFLFTGAKEKPGAHRGPLSLHVIIYLIISVCTSHVINHPLHTFLGTGGLYSYNHELSRLRLCSILLIFFWMVLYCLLLFPVHSDMRKISQTVEGLKLGCILARKI